MSTIAKAIGWSAILACTAGCGSSGKEAYVPSENAGRQALETALTAWQGGKPMALISADDGAAVQPQDFEWKGGKKLIRFTIVKEVPSTEGAKQFAVQLTFQGVAKPVDAAYFVVGRDPLWVFRDRDYHRASAM
jgi:hypothetical protein